MKMPLDRLFDFIFSIQIWDVAKLVASLTLLLYVIFAWIVVRQVNLMARTLIVPIDLPIKMVAWIHLGLAIFLFLLALVIL